MSGTTTQNEILISRVFDAPRELVYQAWTDPEQLVKWYAPAGFEIFYKNIASVQGGAFLSCVSSPEYGNCWCKGVFLELAPPERIAFTMVVSDENGNSVQPVDAGMHPDWPAETLVFITLEELDGKTKLTLRQTVDQDLAQQTGALPSWFSMFDKLEKLLSTH